MSTEIVLALLTGLFAGALFSFIQIPIPAPPNLTGVTGIFGIYLGYKGVEALGYHVDALQYVEGLF